MGISRNNCKSSKSVLHNFLIWGQDEIISVLDNIKMESHFNRENIRCLENDKTKCFDIFSTLSEPSKITG